MSRWSISNFIPKTSSIVDNTFGKFNPITGPLFGDQAKKLSEEVRYDPNLFAKLKQSLQKSRADKNADAASLEEQNAIAQEMATMAENKYISGKLDPGQIAQVNKWTAGQKAQIRQMLGSAGMADSSTRALEEGNIDMGAVGMKDQMLDTEFQNTMQALGMSSEAAQIMSTVSTADRTQAMSIYSSFAQAIGTWAGESGQTPQNTGGNKI